MNYDVRHVTEVTYATPVRLARFNLRLRPAPWPTQRITGFTLDVDPLPWTRDDRAGGYVVEESKLVLRQPVARLRIESRFHAEVAPGALDHATVPSPAVADVRTAALALPDLGADSPASYLFAGAMTASSPAICAWTSGLVAEDAAVLDAGRTLMHAIHDQFAYESGVTFADTAAAEAFEQRRGVCQDFAHVMIVAARALGLPAAYVSGYLRTTPPPGRPRLVGVDAMHAWAALWCGQALGWVGFDPTNAMLAETSHIFVAMGRDYADVAPLDGVYIGTARQTLRYSVDVAPVE